MPNTASAAAIEVKVQPAALAQLYADAKAAPGVIQRELRRGVVKAADPIRLAVIASATFSSRIPQAVKAKARFSASEAHVRVYVDAKMAPEAAPINNRGRGGNFRHPVYGNRDVWVNQKAIPFFDAGVRAGEAEADRAMLECMDRTAAALGFH